MADEVSRFAARAGLSGEQAAELQRLVASAAFALAAPLVGESVLEGYLDAPAPTAEASGPPEAARYTTQRLLGRGGMGEVWRVYDAVTERHMAMKILRPDLGAALGELFTAEARLTAQLEHPGIVSVHDLGVLPDGRRYFTMEEIAGQSFAALIAAVHGASPPDRWGLTPDGVGLRRLLGVLLRVAEATGYAHSRGVLHLDLKPGNIMIGEFGEVRVVDWGLARRTDQGAAATLRGTPAYMAPEQRASQPLSPATDVFAIGGMLYEILTGQPPSDDDPRREARAEPAPLRSARPVPDDLRRLCAAALSQEPGDRPQDAGRFARELSDWLEGARLRDRALAVVAEAEALRPRVAALQAEAEAAGRAARDILRRLPPHAPVADKRPGWQREAEATSLRQQAAHLTLQKIQLLQAAFTHQPDLPEAHRALAAHYRELHEAAEQAGEQAAASHELLLRHHDRAGAHAAYLSGEGAVSLRTEPPEATISLHRGTESDRRIAYHIERVVSAPLERLRLPHGRWLIEVSAPGHHAARLPLRLARAGEWDGGRLTLLPEGALGDRECLVSAGRFTCGGDPGAYSPLPPAEVSLPGFVMKRDPVTNAAYIRFLDSLLDRGDEEAALRFVPRERAGQRGELGGLLYGRDAAGRFVLQEDADGHLWQPGWPVFCIDWHSAQAYAAWLSEETGLPWRLPSEREWEKAAGRGDGRCFPWGDFLDPTWCCVRRSHRGTPLPAAVGAYPGDESPYGVRGLAGNVRDWCADLFHPEGLPVAPEDPDDPALQRTVRGGSWFFLDDSARITSRFGLAQRRGSDNVGFRLVRSL